MLYSWWAVPASLHGPQLLLEFTPLSFQALYSYPKVFGTVPLQAGQSHTISIATTAGKQGYDLSVRARETHYRFAGRVETGACSVSELAMS